MQGTLITIKVIRRTNNVLFIYTDAPKSVLDSFLFFLFYEWFRSLRLRSRRRSARGQGRGLGMMEEIAVGMAAGACSRSFTTPISNIVTRKQTATLLDAERPASVGDIVRSIREEKGIAGFWAGYSATLLLTLNPSLTFFLQEFLKSTFADTRYDDPGSRLTFLFAATSKAMSSFVTYPFQTAKTRMQSGVPVDTGAKNGSDDSDEKREGTAEETGTQPKALRTVKNVARKSVFGTVAHIVRSEGIASLYDGVGAELLKGFFSHGTTMVAKDIVHKLLFKLYLVVVGILAELRRRRLSTTTAESQMLPRALQYRINASLRSGKTTRKMPDYTTNVVANLIDGTQRPFRKR
ncbi:mitochondrial carrier domain-containing protein [Poronia punctata]|nr:mitochondrial carrier domain-containing protein [Poronia punctata]